MAECIHGSDEELCDYCTAKATGSRGWARTMAGHSFALIYAPRLRSDTFLHLNRQGDSWKIRRYFSPSRAPEVVAQSGQLSTKLKLDLDELQIVHDLAYPTSRAQSGVKVTDCRYWHDEIARVNAAHGISAVGSDA